MNDVKTRLPMRLAVLTSHPIQYYAPLFRELAKHFDVEVFFAHKATPAQQAAAGFNTPFDWDIDLLEGYPFKFLRNVARDPGAHRFAGCDTPDIGSALTAGRFGALLVTGWHLKCFWQGVWAAKRAGIPVIVRGDSHLGTPRSRIKRFLKEGAYPPLLRMFDAALYVGQYNRAYYEHYRYPVERLFHSPHCVDVGRFSSSATEHARASLRARLGIGPTDKVVLFAGKLVAFKRPLDLVAAAAVLRDQRIPVHVLVAGSGPLEAQARERSDRLRVPLHLLGFQNQTQMPAVYAAADVLVLPSTGRETWGLVCNEALACGKPIVVSDAVGCVPDLAENDLAGQVFPLGDVVALADTIASLLQSPPSAEDIKRVSDHHSISAAVSGIVKAVEFTVGAPG